MEENYHQEMISKSPFGFAYHKIILDDSGKPVDYEFIEVNDAFAKLTGLSIKDLPGQTVRQVLPGIEKSEFNWIGFYGKIAIEGGEDVFDQYSEPLKRWYKVQVYSPEKYFFATFFTDITDIKEQEARLVKTEKRYRGLVESQSDLIVRVDKENRFTYVNEAYCKAFGKSSHDLIGSDFFPLVHQDDRESTNKAMEQLKVPPYRCYMEQRAMTVNGWRWLAWEDNAILDEKGAIIEVQGVGRDITALKEKEEELRKQAESLQTLLKETPAVIYAYQFKNGAPLIHYISENVKRVLGFEPEAFINNFEFWASCIFPDDLIRLRKIFSNAEKKIIPESEMHEEYRFKNANGNFRWLSDRNKVILNQNNEIEIIGVWVDVTEEKQKTDALNQYKQRLSLAQTFAKTGSWEYDIKTGKLFWSAECEALFGLEEGTFEGTFEDFLKRVHPDDQAYVTEINSPIIQIKEGIPLSYEHRIINQNGDTLWVKETAGVVNDHIGNPSRIIGIMADISSQKIAREAIENEEKLQQIVNNINGVFWLRSADRLDMLYVSPSIESLFGISQQALYDNPNLFTDAVHQKDKERVKKALAEFIETGAFSEEYRIVKPEGEIRWMVSNAFPVKNETGETIRFAGIVNDITKQKESEIAVKEHAQNLNALIEAMPDMIFIMHRDGTILEIYGPDAEKLIAPSDQLIGKSILDCFDGDETKRHLSIYNDCIETGQTGIIEFELTVGDTKLRFESRIKPLDDDRLLTVVRDVTQTRILQNAHKQELDFRKFLFETNKDGMVIFDDDHKVIDVNTEFCQMLGYTADEMKKLHTWHFDTLHDENKVRDDFNPDGEIFRTFETVHQRKDRTTYDVEVSARSIRWKGERLVVCSCRDITERIAAAKRMEASEKKYRQLVESINDVLFTLDHQGTITYMSPVVKSLSGFDAEKYTGAHFSEFVHPEHLDEIMNEFDQLKSGKNSPSEYRILTKSGEDVWVKSHTKPGVNEDGQIEYLGIAQNITESRKAAIEIKESEEKYRMLFNANNDSISIFYIDENGKPSNFIEMNEAGAEIIGYTNEELLNINVAQLEEKVSDSVRLKRIEDIQRNGYAAFETTMQHKSGKKLAMEVKTILINYKGKPAILNIARDITERKQAELSLRSSEADLKRQTRLQQLLMNTSNTYINVGKDDFDHTINKSLAELGEFMSADRCYIFEHDYNRQVTNNTHEWCADGIEPQIDQLQDTPFELFSDWLEANQKDETVYIHDVLKLPEGDSIRNILEPQGIKSLIAVPITDSGKCTGFIGFDSVRMHHIYTKTEDSLLRVFAQMLVSVNKRINIEQQIRESREKYQIVAENTISWEFWEAPDGEFLYHSPSCEMITGFKAEDLIRNYQLFLNMIHPDDLGTFMNHRHEIAHENHLRRLNFRIINAQGEIRHIEHQCLPVFGFDGTYLGIRGSNVDITERKQAEEAIHRGRQRLESFLEISRGITSTLDQEKIMQMVVDNAIRIMGLGSGAIYLQNDEETIRLEATSPALPDDFPDVFLIASLKDHPHIAKTFATGSYQVLADSSSAELSPAEQEIIKLRGLRSNLYLPIRLREKTIGVLILSSVGETYSFTSEEINLLQGFANQAAQIIDNISNFNELKKYAAELEQQIVQRKEAENLLRESEYFANAIANNTPALLWIYDLEKKQNLWTNAVHKAFFSQKYSDTAELKYDDVSQFIHPDDFRKLLKKTDELINNPQIQKISLELRIRQQDGWKWMNAIITTFKVSEQNKTTQILGALFDIDDRKKAEEVIRQNEERFRQVAETNQTVIWEINTEGIYTYVSPMAEKIWGYKPADLVGKVNYFNLHPEEGRQEYIEQTMKFLTETGSFNDLVNPIQKRDGSMIWVTSNGLPIFDEHGTLTGYRGSDQDITERLLAENELRKFKTISDQANYGTAITDLEGTIIYVNEYYAQMHGWDSKLLIGENLTILYNEQHLPKVNKLLQELKTKGSLSAKEVDHISKDGIEFPTLTNASVVYDEHQQPIFMATSAIDITEIKAARLELLKLTQAVVQSPVSVIITDTNGVIEYVNPRFIEISGFSSEEVIGQHTRVLNSGHQSDAIYKELWNTILSGKMWQGELLNKKKNGDLFWEKVSISPIKDDQGETIRFLAIKEDITKQKKLMEDLIIAKDKAEESNRLKTAFMNNISHEVRTPLNGILGFGDFMLDNSLDQTERLEYYNILKHSSDRLQQTITDIMDISELTAGSVNPNYDNVQIVKVITRLTEDLRNACAQKNILVSFQIPDDTENLVLHTDEEIFTKILRQLLSNAEKFTTFGRIILGFQINGVEIEFFVKDTGQGIATDKMELIFEPFMQEDVSTTRGHEGSGLGLAIARRFVELLNGKLWVESVKDKGSTFFFTLPLETENMPMPLNTETESRSVKTTNPLILIAEDDMSNFLYIKALLQKAGYSAVHAINGAEAVEFCQQYPEITLVLMDIKMPVMNGLEATEKIREFRHDLPIIALTAYAQTGDKHRILEVGCDEYLAKPVTPKNLLDIIKKFS
jgi:PAS domain S-box-containing protein